MVRRSTALRGATRTALLVAVALVVLGLVAPAAGAAAVRVQARVEGLGGTVAPATTIDVPGPATFADDAGHSAAFPLPVAMGALAVLADAHGFPFTTNDAMTFVNSVAGVGGPPDWSSWWLYSVNGWGPDVGAGDLVLRAGDAVVFYQVDAAAPWMNKQLVVRVAPRRGLLPGQAVTIAVVGDDLARVNSATDAARWGLDAATDVETPAQFAPVTGATLHVGRRTYALDAAVYGDGSITLTDLPLGTYRVWAERAPDAVYNYVRSAPVTINVDRAPEVSGLRVSPSPYRAGRRMTVRFALDKAASVSARIVNARGRVVATLAARSLGTGSRTLTWNGRTGVALTGRLSVTVRAVDSWGRAATATARVRVTR